MGQSNDCEGKNKNDDRMPSIPPSSVQPESSTTKEWKLENSSFWWLGHDIFQNPANILLFSSIPFCAGAYFGYKAPTEKMEELIGLSGGSSSSLSKLDPKEFGTEGERRAAGFKMASRALRLATLSSFGTFGMIGAGT
jgi:hypothetical protein